MTTPDNTEQAPPTTTELVEQQRQQIRGGLDPADPIDQIRAAMRTTNGSTK